MFDAVQVFFKKLWDNIIKPGLIYLGIATVFFFAGFIFGTISKPNLGFSGSGTIADREQREATARIHSELKSTISRLERQLGEANTTITGLIAEQQRSEVINKRLDDTIGKLEAVTRSNLESIGKLKEIFRILRDYYDSTGVSGSN